MRFLVILICLVSMATAAGSADSASETSSYCVNKQAEFYPYHPGRNCKTGYQLAPGNCRLPDGKLVAVEKGECARQTGTVQLPFPPVLLAPEAAKPDADKENPPPKQ